MHDIQIKILKELLFNRELRFTDLNIDKITNDHFTFHVRRLVELGLVIKKSNGFYELTDVGKEFANTLDADGGELKIEKQAKVSVLAVCTSGSKLLMQKRLKQPFYGHLGFISGKIKWGETIYDAVARELEEETGLSGNLRLAGIEHKIDYSKDNKLLEDKYFYVFEITDCAGELIEEFEGGKNMWIEEEEIRKSEELFNDVLPLIEIIKKNRLNFLEKKYIVERY